MTMDPEHQDADEPITAEEPITSDELLDLLYTAIGFGVLGAQRLRYAARQLNNDVASRLREASPETRSEVAKLADALDASLEKLQSELPQPISEAVTVTLSAGRHLREQMLDPWVRKLPGES